MLCYFPIYKAFNDTLTQVAHNWDSSDVDLDAANKPREHGEYALAAIHALAQIRRTTKDERVQNLATKTGVAHGTKVILRYFNHAISSAAHYDVPLETAIQFLASPSEVDPLTRIASSPNSVAKHIEGELCIMIDSVPTLETPEHDIYVWDGSELLLESRYPSYEQRAQDLREQCPAQKTRQLGMIATSLLEICTKDERLFERTYTAHARKVSSPLL